MVKPSADAKHHALVFHSLGRRRVDRRRPRPHDPGGLQPAEQRHQVHAGRRPHRGAAARESGANAEISVSDNGPGIAPASLPRVFMLFAQGEQEISRPQGGLGLGLTLVEQLVTLHGGDVSAFSKGTPGEGAEFIIRLPRVAAPLEKKKTTAPRPARWCSWSTTTAMRPRRCACSWRAWATRHAPPSTALRRSMRSRSSSRTSCCWTSACRASAVSRWPGACTARSQSADAGGRHRLRPGIGPGSEPCGRLLRAPDQAGRCAAARGPARTPARQGLSVRRGPGLHGAVPGAGLPCGSTATPRPRPCSAAASA
jgi:hypothetical protein